MLVPDDQLALFVSTEKRNLFVNRHPGLVKCPVRGVMEGIYVSLKMTCSG